MHTNTFASSAPHTHVFEHKCLISILTTHGKKFWRHLNVVFSHKVSFRLRSWEGNLASRNREVNHRPAVGRPATEHLTSRKKEASLSLASRRVSHPPTPLFPVHTKHCGPYKTLKRMDPHGWCLARAKVQQHAHITEVL